MPLEARVIVVERRAPPLQAGLVPVQPRVMHPTFLVIGAARSGTTTLFNLLSAHPQIYLPKDKRPEPHFFLKDSEYAQGLDYYESRWFAEADEPARGEVSTSYLYQPWVPERINSHYPDMQFIAILRDPIERAWSNYWHSVRNGLEKESFDFAVRNEAACIRDTDEAWKQVAPYAYVDRGLYAGQLQRFFESFPQEQFFIQTFESFFVDPLTEFGKLIDFLGVDRDVNATAEVAITNRSAPQDETMDLETRRYLEGVFEQPNRELAALLDLDLSVWS
jgi:hypothetical protein